MIELRDVRKCFGELKAVNGVSLSTGAGEVFGLLGPNGAGKSTTIRMIMKILAPDSGSILFNGRPILEEDKARIGYLPEERGLYRKVGIGEMLLYLASLKGADPASSARRLDEWLERFGLAKWKRRPPEELSRGMAQKAQFIAAILHDPEFIFLDEPFSGLDPVSTDELREAVLELAQKGRTVLLSTHNMEVAEKICSRILIIDHGRVIVSGPLADIKSRYGKNSISVEFDGELDLERRPLPVSVISRFPRYIEMELAGGASAQEVLAALVGRVSIRRFEVVAPSLHGIFVQIVGKGEQGREQRAQEARV
jgi:ABC-2 type transport system ATP-binding protein